MGTSELDNVRRPDDPTRIGRYDVVRKLAIGGMAELYLARARGLEGFEKLVVLKRMLPEFTRRASYVAMFLDEARLAARLHHPSLVQAYDIGESGGEYFFSMEFVHGHDLRTILKRSAGTGVPLDVALSIGISIASGLHYAHELTDPQGAPLNVVHRDISPSNVLLSFDGHAKLLDFGVAKAETSSEKTKSGTVKGKAGYMSPEQCQAEQLDRRSDIFSLGIVLYEMTLGKRLFRRDNELGAMMAIVQEDVEPPSKHRADYPAELERIVMRALEKDADVRYRTAQQLQIELEELVRTEQLSTSPIRRAAFMESLFGDELEAWRKARARGQSLAGLLSDSAGPAAEEEADFPSYSIAITTASQALSVQEAETATSHSHSSPARDEPAAGPRTAAPRRVWPWLAALGGIAVAALGWVLLGSGGAATAPQPSNGDQVPAATAPVDAASATRPVANVTPPSPDAGAIDAPSAADAPAPARAQEPRKPRPNRAKRKQSKKDPASETPLAPERPSTPPWNPDSPTLR